MSQSPYANLTGDLVEPLPQRTSVLAIISLVLAIISVVPLFCIFLGSGALAVIFGGASLLLINRERGRLAGTGMAATGIVIGLIVTVVQIAGVMIISRGMQFMRTNVVGPIDTSMRALDKGDLVAARKMLTPTADAAISDEALNAFAAAYKSRLGGYKGLPDSLLDLVAAYSKVGAGLQSMQGRNDTMPFPANFDKGEAALLIVIDQQAAQSGRAGAGATAAIPVRNIGIATPDGKTDWLIDPATIFPAPRTRPERGATTEPPPSKPGDDLETSPVPATSPEQRGGSGPSGSPK